MFTSQISFLKMLGIEAAKINTVVYTILCLRWLFEVFCFCYTYRYWFHWFCNDARTRFVVAFPAEPKVDKLQHLERAVVWPFHGRSDSWSVTKITSLSLFICCLGRKTNSHWAARRLIVLHPKQYVESERKITFLSYGGTSECWLSVRDFKRYKNINKRTCA